jgi:hypothetical protein
MSYVANKYSIHFTINNTHQATVLDKGFASDRSSVATVSKYRWGQKAKQMHCCILANRCWNAIRGCSILHNCIREVQTWRYNDRCRVWRWQRDTFKCNYGQQWKQRVQQFLYCCVRIHYGCNVFTEPLPSSNRGINITHTDWWDL